MLQAYADAGLTPKDGEYTIDVDGPNGAQPMFKAYCDMTIDGGGWTLWASVVNTSDSTFGPIAPGDSAYMDVTRYQKLQSISTMFRARGTTTHQEFFVSVAEALSAKCHDLTTPVSVVTDTLIFDPAPVLVFGWKETAGCDSHGNDYAHLSVRPGSGWSVQSSSSVGLWHKDSPNMMPTQGQPAYQSTEDKVELYLR